ncbi:MAG: glycosyltransferase family 2 protein [Anaerolineae bacterium]|nr:glycosyltransferase family 2 protein [Anaerolineae bacterium]
MKTDLSIIIVTYNGRDITLKTLGSYEEAVAADLDHSHEIIVVDNASQDSVADAVEEHFPDVHLIRLQENDGFSAGNNVGFASSSGRYILFSNPDIEVNGRTLPTLIELMDQNLQVGACTPFLKLVTTGDIDWGAHRGFPTPWAAFTYFTKISQVFKKSKRLSKVFGQYHLLDRDLKEEHEVDAIRGGFFFVRRDVFEQTGGWDEDYFMFGEDIDLCYQIKKRGHAIMFYPQASALHYHGMTTGLKGHSQDLSAADAAARDKAYNAFYDTMKIFYDKNYKDKYNKVIRWLVFCTVEAKRRWGKHSGTV